MYPIASTRNSRFGVLAGTGFTQWRRFAHLQRSKLRSIAALHWLLQDGETQEYKGIMRAMGELGHEGLPRPIPAEDLQTMLGASEAFCSWDASRSKIVESMARWPFLFAYPLMGTCPTTPRRNAPSQ